MGDPTDDLARLWEWFAMTQCHGESPLYERISLVVAGDRDLLDLIRAAPPAAHMPLTLFGAVHYLLLAGLEHPLADVYAGRSDADPGPLFLDVCRVRREDVVALLATRRVQTNDCGRSAAIGPGLTWLSSRLEGPFALVDVGASAGINLLCDRYRIDYGRHGATGPVDAPVHIGCRVVAGSPPIAPRLPLLAARVGIDRSPVDLADPDDARWLLACVWPDTGRLERTAASIRLARADPPGVIGGDATETLPGVLSDLPGDATAVVVTTSAFAYFGIEERRRFIALLEEESHHRRIAWLSAENRGVVEPLAGAMPLGRTDADTDTDADADADARTDADVLGVVDFLDGASRARLLGLAHKHGAWIDWRDTGEEGRWVA